MNFLCSLISWIVFTFADLIETTENQKEESPGVLRARNRNSRVPFTRKQVERLEAIFGQTNYLSGREVTEVARELQISESRVSLSKLIQLWHD